MQEMSIIVNQIAALIILAVIGYIARKSGFLSDGADTVLSKVLIRITAPALIISTMTSYNFDAATLSDGLLVGLLAIIFMFFALFTGMLFSRVMKLDGSTANVFKAHLMFGNVGYLALPLFKAVLGERAVVVAAFFVLAFELLCWTTGVFMLNKHKGLPFVDTIKKFISPNTISCLIGLIFAFTGLHRTIEGNAAATVIYNFFYSALNPLGNCTLPLVMLFIGISAANNPSGSFAAIVKKPVTLVLSLLKLLVIPFAVLAILLLLGDLINPFVRTIVILDMAMPCAAIIAALSADYGSDFKQATDNVIYTTVLSLFTLPIFILLLNYL
jgi:malate permease and related proteins